VAYNVVEFEVTVNNGDPVLREKGEEGVACLLEKGHLGNRRGDGLLACRKERQVFDIAAVEVLLLAKSLQTHPPPVHVVNGHQRIHH